MPHGSRPIVTVGHDGKAALQARIAMHLWTLRGIRGPDRAVYRLLTRHSLNCPHKSSNSWPRAQVDGHLAAAAGLQARMQCGRQMVSPFPNMMNWTLMDDRDKRLEEKEDDITTTDDRRNNLFSIRIAYRNDLGQSLRCDCFFAP